MAFGIGMIVLLLPHGIVLATTFTLLALSAGELFSILLLGRLKKHPPVHFENGRRNKCRAFRYRSHHFIAFDRQFHLFWNRFAIRECCLPWAIRHRYRNTLYGYQCLYHTVNDHGIIFGIRDCPGGYSPYFGKPFARKTESIRYLIRKCFAFSFVPGFLLSFIFYLYPAEFMQLIYNTTEGASYLRPFVLVFVLYYLQAPVNAILQALGKAKMLFLTSTVFNILRVVLILLFAKLPFFGLDSIFYAILTTVVLSGLTSIIQLLLITKYRFEVRLIFNTILLIGATIAFALFLNRFFAFSFLLKALFLSLFFIFFAFYLKIISIESLIKKNPRST